MICPRCGSKTYIVKTFIKNDRVFRNRKCNNKNCNYKVKTTEIESSGWRYKDIVKKIKELVREVK